MPLPYVAQAHSRSDTKTGADRPRVSSEERKEPMKAKNRSFDRDPRAIFLESYPDRFPESSSDDPTVVFHDVYVAARQQAHKPEAVAFPLVPMAPTLSRRPSIATAGSTKRRSTAGACSPTRMVHASG